MADDKPPSLGRGDRDMLQSILLRSNITGPANAAFVNRLVDCGLRGLDRPPPAKSTAPDAPHPKRMPYAAVSPEPSTTPAKATTPQGEPAAAS